MRRRRTFLRDLEGPDLFELFLLAAVSSILITRFVLHLLGYPRLGGAHLHIAHVLWGGLLLAVGILGLLMFLDRSARRLAALAGGVGFGLFIDEAGKFVTHDSNYFYRPAIALIYASFILLYVLVRWVRGEGRATPEEHLVNALKELSEVAVGDLSRDERDRALALLDRSDPDHPLVPPLRALLLRSDLLPPQPPGPLVRLRWWVSRGYRRLVAAPWFATAIVVVFVGQLAVRVVHVGGLVLLARTGPAARDLAIPGLVLRDPRSFGAADWGQLASTTLSAAFVAAGITRLRGCRLDALRMLQRSVLVTIFLTQVFMFYSQEWGALVGLIWNLLLDLALRLMIARERAPSGVQD